MSDVFDKLQRSAVMRSVASRDTAPERRVVAALHQMGHRFAQHDAQLPGIPDLVLRRRRLAIFVHGCFWHGHDGCKHARRPTSNRSYWDRKLDGNLRRDRSRRRQLNRLGWRTAVIWECQTRDVPSLQRRLQSILRRCAAPTGANRNPRSEK
ncbi:MAG: DNA mismatch endonuclease Vsr [Leptospirales bacterium]|nr:DNA mismatch endonuclease Vsr [Leptospirales bacterium]